MSVCPLTGKECDKDKCYLVNYVLINSGKTSYEVCEDCLKSYTVVNPTSIPKTPAELLVGIMDVFAYFFSVAETTLSPALLENQSEKMHKTCNGCGISLEELMKNQRLGCAECYNVFEPELEKLILSCQGSLEHLGKFPKKSLQKKINMLDTQLQILVSNEEYEKAGEIQNKITQVREIQTTKNRIESELEAAILEEKFDKVESLNQELTLLMQSIKNLD